MDPNTGYHLWCAQKKQDWISMLLSMHPIPLAAMRRNMTFFVNPGSQSILFKEINLATYGDPPIDLNWTAASELPVELKIVEGLENS